MSTLREELEANYSAMLEGGEGDGAQAAPAAAETQDPTPAPAPAAGEGQAQNQAEAAAAAAARVRDEAGRFTKAPEGQQTKPETAAPAGQEPPPAETIQVPASLPAALKAKFSELPPEWQDAFRKRDGEVNAAKAQWDEKGHRLNRFDEILGPRRERFLLAGSDEFQAIQTLFAAQDLLERDPVQGLHYLARSYGVDLGRIAQGGQGQAQPAPTLDPNLQPIFQQIQTLTQRFDARDREAEQTQLSTASAAIEAFRADPKHLYFDNVRPQMIGLMRAGQAKTLDEAYDMACWASPEIRSLLQQEQAAKAQASQQEAAERERVAKAQRAAGSVTGAPGSAAPPPSKGSIGSVRDDLQAALAAMT